jgi:hypothetical protein
VGCGGHQQHGRAVQVDPMKPTLKAPGTKRLKLKHDQPLRNFAFKFKLRRYDMGCDEAVSPPTTNVSNSVPFGACSTPPSDAWAAGAYTRSLFSST